MNLLKVILKINRFVSSLLYNKNTWIVYEKELEIRTANIQVNKDNVEFEKVNYIDDNTFSTLKKINPLYTIKIFEYEIKNKHECFIGKAEGDPVFYVWTRRYLGTEIATKKSKGYAVESASEIHFFSACTKESERGKNIYPAGIQFLEDYYRTIGFKKISCTVRKNNGILTIPQKSLLKVNFHNTGKEITIINILFIKINFKNYF